MTREPHAVTACRACGGRGLTTWNLESEIRAQLGGFRGRFIVPIPEPKIV